MIVLNMLISVYHAEPEIFYDWFSCSFNCQIIDQLDCYMYVSSNGTLFKSPLKTVPNGLNEGKQYWTYITKHSQA